MVWPFTKKPESTNKPAGRRVLVRAYEAARIDRLTASLTASSQSVDWDLRRALAVLRARSRHHVQNNPYAAKFLAMVGNNVVGPNGFGLQVRVTEPTSKGNVQADQLASDAIEKAFADWSKPQNCDITGKQSFTDLCSLFIRSVAQDGEALVRKVYGKQAGKYGFALQVLDIDRLDIEKNETLLPGGAYIKMGVECTAYGKPVAYWLRTKHPGDNIYSTNTGTVYERVPASDIYHCFIPVRPEQTRGVPWMAAALLRLNQLGGYEEAAVIAARVGASQMGFFTSPEGDGTAISDGEDATGQLMKDADPGVFGVLPPGFDFKQFDPDYPHAMYDAFVKACLRGISSGIGVSYNSLANDLEGVNFSSSRVGVIDERDSWMCIQRWMIEHFLTDVFETWLLFALASKAIVQAGGSALPASKFDKFNAATWQGRRWQWVDPEKEINAAKTAVDNGFKSRRDVIAEQGRDLEDVFMQLQREQDMIAALKLELDKPGNPQPQQAAQGQPAQQ